MFAIRDIGPANDSSTSNTHRLNNIVGLSYIHDVCIPVSIMLGRASLHLADRGDLIVPRTRTTSISHSCLLLSAPVI